jgi:hypothetical protein
VEKIQSPPEKKVPSPVTASCELLVSCEVHCWAEVDHSTSQLQSDNIICYYITGLGTFFIRRGWLDFFARNFFSVSRPPGAFFCSRMTEWDLQGGKVLERSINSLVFSSTNPLAVRRTQRFKWLSHGRRIAPRPPAVGSRLARTRLVINCFPNWNCSFAPLYIPSTIHTTEAERGFRCHDEHSRGG